MREFFSAGFSPTPRFLAIACAVGLMAASNTAARADLHGLLGPYCHGATGPKISRTGERDDCGGPAYTWCAPPGQRGIDFGSRCGPPNRGALAAAWAAYNRRHGRSSEPSESSRSKTAEAKSREAAGKASRAAAAPQSAPSRQTQADCSTITGLGDGGSGPSNCTSAGGTFSPGQGQGDSRPAGERIAMNAAPSVKPIVLPPPECRMCDVLRTVGEIVPDLAEKLDNIKPEIVEVELPLYNGGPNTLHPYLPTRPLSLPSEPTDPLDTIKDIKDLTDDAREISELAEKNKEAEDEAEQCRNGYVDAAWKIFSDSEGSAFHRAQIAKDAIKKCLTTAMKNIAEPLAGLAFDSTEDN